MTQVEVWKQNRRTSVCLGEKECENMLETHSNVCQKMQAQISKQKKKSDAYRDKALEAHRKNVQAQNYITNMKEINQDL